MTTGTRAIAGGTTIAVLAIFVLSGAAGLIYEIVWSRQLVLVFGNTTQAVSAILTGFFGGMAIGAAVGGRIADRVRSPLRMYGILELALVAVVLVTPISFRLIHEVYRGIYPTLENSPQLLAIVRLVLAVLALAPATILMGATFPSLTRHLARSSALSRAFGRLYAANTLGAIAGTLAAGLVLIEVFGLSTALAIGAGCSAIAGVAALLLSRRDGSPDPESAPVDPSTPAAPAAPPRATSAAHRPGGDPGPRSARTAHLVHLRADVARLPGDVDATARVGHGQHDVRVHRDPRRLPDGDRDRCVDLQCHPPTPARPPAAARHHPDRGGGAGPHRAGGRHRAARATQPGRADPDAPGAVRRAHCSSSCRSPSSSASRSRPRRRCCAMRHRPRGPRRGRSSPRTRSGRSPAACSSRSS